MRSHYAAYPLPPTGHHPNFRGATEAAERLITQLEFQNQLKNVTSVLCYPDYVLKPVRRILLEKGFNVVVPSKYGKKYRFLDAKTVSATKSSSISGAEKEGILLKSLPETELAVVSCVALTRSGDLLSKGYGFKLPEGLGIPVVSIAHPVQVLNSFSEMDRRVAHIKINFFATPEDAYKID